MSMNEQEVDGVVRVRADLSQADKGIAKTTKIMEDFAKKAEAASKRVDASLAKIGTGRSALVTQRLGIRRDVEKASIFSRGSARLAEEESRRTTKIEEAEQRRLTQINKVGTQERYATFVSDLRKRERAHREAISGYNRDQRTVDAIIKRSLQAPLAMQARVSSAIQGGANFAQRQALIAGGLSPSQAFMQMLTPVAGQQGAAFLAGGGGKRPPNLGGTPPGGGRFGGIGGQVLRGVAGGLGIGTTGLGAFAAIQAGREVIESTKLATAYGRQKVAAEGLAGSQAQLNALLQAYAQASGGAVDKVTSLANVTRLLATGFAKTVPEAERFVRATRGASIALGRPQEEVTQETQLAISNTSVKRLDQIGLGITEVNTRIEELRKTNGSWTREMAFQDAVLSVMEEKYGHLTKTVEGQATSVEKLAATWSDLRLEMGKFAQQPVNLFAKTMDTVLKVGAEKIRQEFKELDSYINAARFMGDNPLIFGGVSEAAGKWGRSVRTSSERALYGAVDDRQTNAAAMSASIQSRTARGSGYSDETMAGLRDFEASRLAIEENFQAERLAATTQYEESRTSAIRNYEKQIAREAEDFAIRRSRSARDYNKQVADLIDDAAKRDEEMVEDYTERVAEAREDSEKRIAEINEKYQEDREKSAEEHRDRLLKAAGALDAIAVLEERKRYRRENKDREDAHRDQLDEAKDALEEQLEDAREAHLERLEDAREADAERLKDMQEARDQQQSDEDADRALQLARAQEDHDDQLAELDRQHGLRMKQIEDNAAKEREQWQKEFEDFAIEHNVYIKGLTEKREKADKLTLGWLDKLIEELEKRIESFKTSPRGGARETVPGEEPLGFARGGRVGRTGPAILHNGEFVLSRGMLAGSQPVPSGVANAVGNKNIVIQSGAITLYPAPGWDSNDMLESLESQLIELLDRT